jgi:pimeloyl-ACP methyl ester carboxylesterase
MVPRLLLTCCLSFAAAAAQAQTPLNQAPLNQAPLKSKAPVHVAATHATTVYKTADIDGLKIFYREAGPKTAPTVLLLHGFPSSSRMFDTLIPLLADKYHLVAPDYPGFGQSDAPAPDQFNYTFDNIAAVVDKFTQTLGLSKYALYVQDYGGPIGFRLAAAHPERVTAIVVQNAVAHNDGLDEKRWAPRRAFWADRAKYEDQFRKGLISPDGAKARHLGSSPHPERYSPDLWQDEIAHLHQPGMAQIQLELFYDFRTNVAAFPVWQDYLRKHKPPLLVTWGKYDQVFAVPEAEAFRRDVPNAEIHVLEAGHFALDEDVDEIAALMRAFLAKKLPQHGAAKQAGHDGRITPPSRS